MSRKYNVGLYLRVSKEDDNASESNSIKSQRIILNSYIKENEELNLVGEYVDDGFSGTNFKRPSFLKMIEDVKNGKINTVVVKDLSRFGRNYGEVSEYLEVLFPILNVRFISLGDQLDNKDNLNEIDDIVVFKNVINDLYAKEISKKVKAINSLKRQNNEFVGGLAPYGYKLNKYNKFEINEETANIVKEIFELTLQGVCKSDIIKSLNDRKIKTPLSSLKNEQTDKKWNTRIIDRILKNDTYVGVLTQNKRKKISYKIKKSYETKKEEWQVIENHHPKIISKEHFDVVQNILKGNYTSGSNFLTNFLKCNDCGNTMTIRKSKNKTYFNCSTYIRKKECFSHSISKDKVIEVLKDKFKEDISLKLLMDNIEMIKVIDENNIEVIDKK